MGVPVISWDGRLTSSISSADCENWIAADQAAYVVQAQHLAAKGQRDATQRQELRDKIQASALSDGARLCRELLPRGLPGQGHCMKADKGLLKVLHQIDSISEGITDHLIAPVIAIGA